MLFVEVAYLSNCWIQGTIITIIGAAYYSFLEYREKTMESERQTRALAAEQAYRRLSTHSGPSIYELDGNAIEP